MRQRQATRLNKVFGADKRPVIVAGDLNATPDSRPLAILAKYWKPVSTGKRLFTIPVGKPTRQIDFVLNRPAATFRIVKSRVLDEVAASNHRPLLVVLDLLQ